MIIYVAGGLENGLSLLGWGSVSECETVKPVTARPLRTAPHLLDHSFFNIPKVEFAPNFDIFVQYQ